MEIVDKLRRCAHLDREVVIIVQPRLFKDWSHSHISGLTIVSESRILTVYSFYD